LVDSCEHGNDPLGPINGGKIFQQLSSWLLKKESAPLR
jgi:hypothetical protein